jgi:hypothetical protein
MRQRYYLPFGLSFILFAPLFGQTIPKAGSYIPYTDAQPVLETLADDLPSELKGKNQDQLKAAWPSWVSKRDAEIRRRLTQGDEDSLVNFLLFGSSFTGQPRITGKQLALLQQRPTTPPASQSDGVSKVEEILRTRISDLTKGLMAPGNNERLLFARHLIVEQKGYGLTSAVGREQIRKYLLSSLGRVLSEQVSYGKTLEDARLLGDASEEFYERSRLYRNRGLSLDTSLLPNFALEEALKTMKARGLLKEGSVRRVAIVGPGLDFTDKQEGYDFYPQQSIQPFAVIDSLVRLGLSPADEPQLVTLDLSPRVNDHLERARRRAQRDQGYVVQLPRNMQAQWKAAAVGYWERFGDQIGVSEQPVVIPAEAADVKVRAVRIRSSVVSRITPVDLNIVLQRLEGTPSECFDLIIATNILVYYDTFEQSLAMKNLERMIRPGGFLLSNNAVLEYPFFRLHSVDYLTVVYSDRPNDGDHIVWYQRSSD